MHHGREEAIGEGPRLPVVQLPFRRFIELQLRLSGCFGAERRRQVGGRNHREMGDEGILIGIIDLDGDQPDVLDPLGKERERPPIGRVVALHIGDLDDAAAAVAGCRDGIATGDGQRQRLLAQHVQSGIERGHRQLGMERVGRGDHHRVQPGDQHLAQSGVERRDAVAGADGGADRGRSIGQSGEFEAVAIVPEIKGVLGLADEPRPHQPDAQLVHCLSRSEGLRQPPRQGRTRTLNRRADLIK